MLEFGKDKRNLRTAMRQSNKIILILIESEKNEGNTYM